MATDGMVNRWNGVAYPAADERRLASMGQMPGSTSAPFSARGGRRVNGAGLAVTVSSTGNGSVTVGAGPCRIYDPSYATQGAWDAEFPNAVGPLALSARPSSGQSRIDLVVARIYDSDLPPMAVREAKIEIVPGNPGTTPSAPGKPALSEVLGTLTVPSSGTISFTQSPARAVSAGGILPVATTAEMDDLKTGGIAYPGLTVYNVQTKGLFTYDGDEFQGDSGWLALSMGATWTANEGTAYRRKSGFVTVNLNVAKATYAGGEVICTLPVGFRPDRTLYVVGQIAGSTRLFSVHADGGVRSVGNGTVGILGTVTFPV